MSGRQTVPIETDSELPPVPQVDHRAKNTAENIEVRIPRRCDGEAAHRTRAEGEQRQAAISVVVGSRIANARSAGRDGGLRRRAVAQLLAHAFVDQHVGVDRHAQREGSAIAAMPGGVSVACSIDSTATSSSRFTASAIVENTPKSRSRPS